jgi:bis(5'-nucleosyl)-tetraphosphatase (symmetrical)
MRWVIGDIQGCAREFDELLSAIRFDPNRDELWCVGDLINRGPDSLATLRLWQSVGGRSLLGNHEINALLSYSGRRPKELTLLEDLFDAEDAELFMQMLRGLPVFAHLPPEGRGPDTWIVHAGLSPLWTDLDRVSERINGAVHDDDWLESPDVQFAVNVRCCTEAGERNGFTGHPDECVEPFVPWDSLYRGREFIVHGHWAMRGYYRTDRTMGLDSGCVYGGSLTAWCQEEDRIVQVPSRGSI